MATPYAPAPIVERFSALCASIARQIEAIRDWPFLKRLKGMVFQTEETKRARKPFDAAAALRWLAKVAPRELPRSVNPRPAKRREPEYQRDIHAQLCEWNYPRDPDPIRAARQRRKWALLHEAAVGASLPGRAMGA